MMQPTMTTILGSCGSQFAAPCTSIPVGLVVVVVSASLSATRYSAPCIAWCASASMMSGWSRRVRTRWGTRLKPVSSAPGPHISRMALRWAVVPVRMVPSYSAVVSSVIPESRCVRPAPTGATGLMMPGNTWPVPLTFTRGSTTSRIPVTRTRSPGRTISNLMEEILESRNASSVNSASSTSKVRPSYISVLPNRTSSTGKSAISRGASCPLPLMTLDPA